MGEESPCRIFEIGYGRTASRSVAEAFHLLGLNIRHGFGSRTNYEQDAFDKLRHGRFDWGIYESCDFSSNISFIHWYQLYKNIPNSRFVLTVRPVEDWLDSWEELFHSHTIRLRLSEKGSSWAVWSRLIQFGMVGFDREEWGRRYTEHNWQVMTTIEEDRLLVLNVWEMTDRCLWLDIANFIGEQPPKNAPFPKLGRGERPGNSKRLI